MESSVERVLRIGKELAEENERLRAESRRLIAEAKQRGEYLLWLVSEVRHQWQDHKVLQEAIRSLHRCRSQHVASFAVRKVFEGNTVWDRTVEEFKLTGHRQAKSCYAWHYQAWGKSHVFSVLKVSPVDSPQRAVQLALAARGEYQSKPRKDTAETAFDALQKD